MASEKPRRNDKKIRGAIGWFLKWLVSLLFNKIFYVTVSVCAQIGWFLLLLLIFMNYSQAISIAVNVLAIAAAFKISSRKINPSYKLAWSLVILASPVFGLLLYVLFGNSRIARKMEREFQVVQNETKYFLLDHPDTLKELSDTDDRAALQEKYIYHSSGFPIRKNTSARYFTNGESMFPVFLEELGKAEHYIFIEYFIISSGTMWDSVLKILESKAAEGVDVRLIYDGFGCLPTLPVGYYKKLREKGIRCVVFNPFRPILNIIQNNRDHRKICVIDGHTAFTGGVNLSDEYINKIVKYGYWKDTAIMLKGEAVWNMTAMFLHMWQVINPAEKVEDYSLYFPRRYHPAPFPGNGYVQPFCDSPLDTEIVSENVYLNMIGKAKRYIYICTPYLIIDNEMMTALTLAAKSGIDVRILVPGIPDKKLVFLLTESYFEQLLEGGVKIYRYMPGFLHTKAAVCDDELAVCGTINLDYRSLYLHFENGVFLYRNEAVDAIRTDILNCLKDSESVSLKWCRERKASVRFIQNIFRVVAPMI